MVLYVNPDPKPPDEEMVHYSKSQQSFQKLFGSAL